MAIKIEVLSIQPGEIRAAFYYNIPAPRRLPDANDQSRTPAGTRLSTTEIQALKDGKLFEVVIKTGNSGNVLRNRRLLEKLYADNTRNARKEYKNKYSNVINAWDGTDWI